MNLQKEQQQVKGKEKGKENEKEKEQEQEQQQRGKSPTMKNEEKSNFKSITGKDTASSVGETNLDADHPLLDGQFVLKEDGGPYPYDRETFLELKEWCDREPGVDTETWFRNLLAAKRNVVRPFTDPFKRAYDDAALESARRQMNLNEELQRSGPSSGWHLDLTSSVLELDGISFPGAVLLGTNTLGEFLWADENHPSSGNLSKESIQAVRNLRKRFSNIPEFVSSGIMVQGAVTDPVMVGFLVSAVASVSMGETWAYYRGPKSETSWLWIAFDASPLKGFFTPEKKVKTENDKIMYTSTLAMELRRNSVQLALSPIPPFDFRRATLSFCRRALAIAGIEDDSIIQERELSEDEARRILLDKQQAVAESSSEDDGPAASFDYSAINQHALKYDDSSVHSRNANQNATANPGSTNTTTNNNTTMAQSSGNNTTTMSSAVDVDHEDESMEVRYVQDTNLENQDLRGWSRFDLWGPAPTSKGNLKKGKGSNYNNKKKSNEENAQDQRRRLATMIFDGNGHVHQVAALGHDNEESDSEFDDSVHHGGLNKSSVEDRNVRENENDNDNNNSQNNSSISSSRSSSTRNSQQQQQQQEEESHTAPLLSQQQRHRNRNRNRNRNDEDEDEDDQSMLEACWETCTSCSIM